MRAQPLVLGVFVNSSSWENAPTDPLVGFLTMTKTSLVTKKRLAPRGLKAFSYGRTTMTLDASSADVAAFRPAPGSRIVFRHGSL